MGSWCIRRCSLFRTNETTLNFANGAGASMSYVWRQRLCAYPVFLRSVGCPSSSSSSFASPSSSPSSSFSWFVLRSPTSMHDKNEQVNDVISCTPQSSKWEWTRMWSESQQSAIRVVRKMRAINVVQLSTTSTRIKSVWVCACVQCIMRRRLIVTKKILILEARSLNRAHLCSTASRVCAIFVFLIFSFVVPSNCRLPSPFLSLSLSPSGCTNEKWLFADAKIQLRKNYYDCDVIDEPSKPILFHILFFFFLRWCRCFCLLKYVVRTSAAHACVENT